MSNCLANIGGVNLTTYKLIHHFGSQFSSKEVVRDGKHVKIIFARYPENSEVFILTG